MGGGGVGGMCHTSKTKTLPGIPCGMLCLYNGAELKIIAELRKNVIKQNKKIYIVIHRIINFNF